MAAGRSTGLAAAALVLLLLDLGSAPARACVGGFYPLQDWTVDNAEIIVRGRVTDYQPVDSTLGSVFKLEFQVQESLRGAASPSQMAYWGWDSDDEARGRPGLPESLGEFEARYGRDLVVGLAPREVLDGPAFDSLLMSRVFPELLTLPWVMDPGCQDPFLGRFDRLEPMLRRKGLLEKNRQDQ